MTVADAVEFFEAFPKLKRITKTLQDVGLGYITLGQQSTTLSGGEAQRVKLATELARVSTGSTLYLLDEPTTGLHFQDIQMLINVLQRLVDQGNTVLVIEHNMDVIKVADHLIDLGPEGGDRGGVIVAAGSPEEVSNNAQSATAPFLRPILRPQ
jgi:excinuclease ABC subunit A